MSDTVPLTYIGPAPEVSAPYGVVERGDTLQVPADAVGEPPRAAKGEPGEKGYVEPDPGTGLLGQEENWARPNSKEARAAASDLDKRRAEAAKTADEQITDAPAADAAPNEQE